jgi:hypothetical protein
MPSNKKKGISKSQFFWTEDHFLFKYLLGATQKSRSAEISKLQKGRNADNSLPFPLPQAQQVANDV